MGGGKMSAFNIILLIEVGAIAVGIFWHGHR